MMMMMMIIKQPSPRSALASLQCRPHMQWLPAPASPSAAQDQSRLPSCRCCSCRRLPGRPGGCGCRRRRGRGVAPPLVCALPGSAWGLGGARGGSPSGIPGRQGEEAAPPSPPGCLPARPPACPHSGGWGLGSKASCSKRAEPGGWARAPLPTW